MASDAPLATLHLWGVGGAQVLPAMTRMALHRRALRATPGLRFAKLVGTGTGRSFTVRDVEPRRWGLFAVWDGRGALDDFEATSQVASSWRRLATETCRIDLAPLRARGLWAGREPFAGALQGEPSDGAVAALTRARIRTGKALTFWRAVPPVTAALHAEPGLRFAVGIGEAPIGLQGTFSVWDSADALTAFAYRSEAHQGAIRRTATERWYAEELFARFAVLGGEGTVGGQDPLRSPVDH